MLGAEPTQAGATRRRRAARVERMVPPMAVGGFSRSRATKRLYGFRWSARPGAGSGVPVEPRLTHPMLTRSRRLGGGCQGAVARIATIRGGAYAAPFLLRGFDARRSASRGPDLR